MLANGCHRWTGSKAGHGYGTIFGPLEFAPSRVHGLHLVALGGESAQLVSVLFLGATIRDTQKKLKRTEARTATPETKLESDNGIRLEDCPPENRVRLFFPGKPEAEVRTNLKRNGFRWAPSLGCWQAYRNSWSLDFAKGVLA